MFINEWLLGQALSVEGVISADSVSVGLAVWRLQFCGTEEWAFRTQLCHPPAVSGSKLTSKLKCCFFSQHAMLMHKQALFKLICSVE